MQPTVFDGHAGDGGAGDSDKNSEAAPNVGGKVGGVRFQSRAFRRFCNAPEHGGSVDVDKERCDNDGESPPGESDVKRCRIVAQKAFYCLFDDPEGGGKKEERFSESRQVLHFAVSVRMIFVCRARRYFDGEERSSRRQEI